MQIAVFYTHEIHHAFVEADGKWVFKKRNLNPRSA
jgi:hypothetical protein